MSPEFIRSLKMEGCREGLSLKSAPQSCSVIQERDKPSQLTAFQHFGYFFVVVVTALRNKFLENFYWSICLSPISLMTVTDDSLLTAGEVVSPAVAAALGKNKTMLLLLRRKRFHHPLTKAVVIEVLRSKGLTCGFHIQS